MSPQGNEAQRLFVGGEWVEPGGGHYEVIDPATEETVGLAPEASREQVYAAAACARDAFAGWSRTTPEERAAILDRAADVMEREFEPYARLAQRESGAPTGIARGMQVGVGVARFRRYARGAMESVETPLAPQINEAGPMGRAGVLGAVAVRRPVGVVTCITSYNNPWANPAGKVAPALAMGNTVVVKPAPQDPLSVYRMAEALEEAGAPPGVVNVVTGSAPGIGEAAVDSPDVDMVSFTGSTAVGQRIAEVCGRGMKRQLMELGGKGAALVFDDADLDSAVMGIGTTFSFYSGQICTAPTRVIAQRGIYDRLVERLAQYAGHLKVGDPTERGTVVGPVISAAHRDRVESYVELAKKEGARLVAGGERPAFDRGFYVAPTLFADCTNDMRVVREEIFGPVVVVVPFGEEEEGIALAEDSEYGLLDYV
ncbi:MAG TPA: aldehyde dehydrogenase family protein, partial [Streptomyces sp.]|nr:aldehyde dehydrogenase family protein [Streptomyces sp.]